MEARGVGGKIDVMTSLSRRSLLAGSAAAGTMLVGTGRAAAQTPSGSGSLDTRALQEAISDLTHPPATSAQLLVDHPGQRWYGTSGVADIGTTRQVRPDDAFRAGSVTKAFVATVVLQLWSRGLVDLDEPLGRHLPGLLPAESARITVAQLLNHTSGLPDHRDLPDVSTPEAVLRHRFDRWTPEELVRTVTLDPLKFRPGSKQEYRGINYVLLALLVEALTGRPYGEVIRERVVRPLGLRGTLIPGHDTRLHGSHVRGYLQMTDGSLRDVTVYDPSYAWGEGELVSTVADLIRFHQALFSGELLPPRAMGHLFTMPPDSVRMLDGSPARYSLGLQQATVNGVTFWGKTGDTYGYRTRVFSTRDQRLRWVLAYTQTRLASAEDMTNRVVSVLTS
ncbi:beta-lactamase family protein [Streptomyces sp. NBC_01003]|uniref:serine hydrolase domain-containing protein n=1 Tax=Streptomyces sp. NBC_01003 TaxID=2903714 RepID=UPI00386B9C99|nr:beta-lactamase family protein [Streptomyces sp. NBC_01003]